MAQLKQLDFVKTTALTEMAYTVVNTVWPDIEAYFDSVGYHEWLQSKAKMFTDVPLQKFLHSYFKALLADNKFYLRSVVLVFDMEGPDYFGKADVYYENLGKGKQVIPVVTIEIAVNQLQKLTYSQFLQTLFHELSHVEQECKILIAKTAYELATTLPINERIPVSSLGQYTELDDSGATPFTAPNEIGAYANDFALKVFHKYRQELKSLSPKDRDSFIRQKIWLQYPSLMSDSLKEAFANAPSSAQKSFLRQFSRQLQEFISGLL